MKIRKLLFLAAVCLVPVGCLFLTIVTVGGRKCITFSGHTSYVGPVVISPDHKTLASGSSDNTVMLWDVATGQERVTLLGHAGPVHSLAFSPDGKTLASGSRDRTVKLWDIATGQERATLLGHHSESIEVAFSPDGKTLATAGNTEATVKLWDVSAGRERATLQRHPGMVVRLAFSPDSKTLASASGHWDGTVTLWDMTTSRERFALRAHPKAWTYGVAFSPDGSTLACGNADAEMDRSEVLLWDTATGQVSKRLMIGECQNESYIYDVTFSPDGKTLAAIETWSAIHVWDVASGQNTGSFNWGQPGPLDSVRDTFLGRFVDALLRKLPVTLERNTELIDWRSVFFKPDGKVVALGGGVVRNSRNEDRYTVKLLEVLTRRNPKK